MGQGQLVIARNNGSYSLEVYLALFVVYWGLITLVEKVFRALEAKLSFSKKSR